MKREKPIIVINSLEMDYVEYFELQISIEEFDAKYDEDFSEFVEENICEDHYLKSGVYEYDGKFGNFEYVIQTDMEEEIDIVAAMKFISKKIEKYFKKKEVEVIQLAQVLLTDQDDIDRSFANLQDLLTDNKIISTELKNKK
jgi:hypothetical protein